MRYGHMARNTAEDTDMPLERREQKTICKVCYYAMLCFLKYVYKIEYATLEGKWIDKGKVMQTQSFLAYKRYSE